MGAALLRAAGGLWAGQGGVSADAEEPVRAMAAGSPTSDARKTVSRQRFFPC